MMRMSFSARLSVAFALNDMPFAIAWVSCVVERMICGGTRSRWKPPGFFADSHAQPARASAVPTQTTALTRPDVMRILLSLPDNQVVDDVRRDQNQQVTPALLLGGKPEQFADKGQVYKQRNSALGYRDLGHRKSANYGRFAVVDQDLIVRLLGLEREPDVHRCGHHVRALGVHFHQDLAIRRHVRRNLEVDTGLLEIHRRAR